MNFTIRTAKRADCPEMLELIRELAVYERAPDEVTVSLAQFEEAGFGERPIWWAFVACASDGASAAEEAMMAELPAIETHDPMIAKLIEDTAQTEEAMTATDVVQTTDALPTEQGMQLDESVTPTIPDSIMEAMPLMGDKMPYGKLIGFALYYLRYSTWKGTRMYLEDILVTESWRGKGVGTALMDALIAAAKAEGLHGISWQVLAWNESAFNFYNRYNPRLDSEWVNVAIDV